MPLSANRPPEGGRQGCFYAITDGKLIPSSIVGRQALTARAVVRLEGIVVAPIGPVAAGAPLVVSRVDPGLGGCRVVAWLAGNCAADQGAGTEGGQRIPIVVIVAI